MYAERHAACAASRSPSAESSAAAAAHPPAWSPAARASRSRRWQYLGSRGQVRRRWPYRRHVLNSQAATCRAKFRPGEGMVHVKGSQIAGLTGGTMPGYSKKSNGSPAPSGGRAPARRRRPADEREARRAIAAPDGSRSLPRPACRSLIHALQPADEPPHVADDKCLLRPAGPPPPLGPVTLNREPCCAEAVVRGDDPFRRSAERMCRSCRCRWSPPTDAPHQPRRSRVPVGVVGQHALRKDRRSAAGSDSASPMGADRNHRVARGRAQHQRAVEQHVDRSQQAGPPRAPAAPAAARQAGRSTPDALARKVRSTPVRPDVPVSRSGGLRRAR